MDRRLVFNGEVAQTQDLLGSELNAYNAFGRLISSVLGQTTQVNGFACTATSPTPSLAVTIGVGEVYILEPTDTAQYGDAPPNGFAPDSTPLMKQGILWESTNLSVTAPVTSGQSINYLIQVGFSEIDADGASRQYYSAPVYRDVFQLRQDGVLLSAKAGSPATTGTQSTPAPDAGYTGLWVVTVAYGQTTVTSGNISQYSNTTFLTDKLKDKITFAQGDTRYLQLTAQPTINYFINPILNIFQATNSLALTSGQSGYCADMIKHVAGTSGAVTATKQSYAIGSNLIPGASTYLRHSQTTGGTGSEIDFYVENVSQFAGQTVTFRVYCSSNTNINIGGAYTQTFGSGGSSNVNGSAITAAQQVTSTPAWLQFEMEIPSITGKTFGNVTGTAFRLTLPNSVFQLNVYGVGVYPGSVAGAVYSQGYDYDLEKCQRFYQTSYGVGFYPGDATQIGLQQSAKKVHWYISGSLGELDIEMIYFEFLNKPYNISNSNVTIYDAAGNAEKISGIQRDGTFSNNLDYVYDPQPSLGWQVFVPSCRNYTFWSNASPTELSDWIEYTFHWVIDCRY